MLAFSLPGQRGWGIRRFPGIVGRLVIMLPARRAPVRERVADHSPVSSNRFPNQWRRSWRRSNRQHWPWLLFMGGCTEEMPLIG